jgi:histidinol-phosphate/aromatic aminotransferase/cobyric acid decarboxylase-like protein
MVDKFGEIWAEIRKRKENLIFEFKESGIVTHQSSANFISFNVPPITAQETESTLQKEGVLVLCQNSREFIIGGGSVGFLRIGIPSKTHQEKVKQKIIRVFKRMQSNAKNSTDPIPQISVCGKCHKPHAATSVS